MSASRAAGPPSARILEVRGLVKHFPVRRGVLRRPAGAVRAVDGVSFAIDRGETLGLVGESGSGKSTTGRAILQLTRPTAGSVTLDGTELVGLRGEPLRRLRRRMQTVFQDPYASLNPRHRIGTIVREPLEVHRIGSRAERRVRAEELLERVGLDAAVTRAHPHELSGGQRQRVGIARALATTPDLVIADEPIAALDVSIQAQIVNLLADLQEELGLAYLFIAHDLAMVRHLSDRVAVMYLGRLVELAEADALFRRPLHPYTRALLSAIPVPDPAVRGGRSRIVLLGDVPDPARPPAGCRFHPRCPHAVERCRVEEPVWRDLGAGEGGPHHVACHRAEEVEGEAAGGLAPPPASVP